MSAMRDAEFVDFARVAVPRLRRVARSVTPDPHRADDLVQATLEKLFVAWPRLERRDEPPWAYAHVTLVNTLLAEERRPWRRAEVSTPSTEMDGRVRDRVTEVTDRVTLQAALAGLPARQRIAVVLRHLEGLSVRETAEAMGCSEGRCSRPAGGSRTSPTGSGPVDGEGGWPGPPDSLLLRRSPPWW